MLDLNDIAVFVRVAQLGCFSRAAHALGMPASTLRRRVSVLEGFLLWTVILWPTPDVAFRSISHSQLRPLTPMCVHTP
jgi:hypothetical protein